ncbi:MAG: NnrU family protein [Halieaceae bacterium]|nr:NnrU family protein [Halieaceae bacterium]MCP5164413.1 NnrU family protein [Pseudomonadales bacterium]
MTLLVLGILLFAGLHLVKSLAPELRAGLIARLGAMPYRGLFSLLVLGSVALIVLGWRSSVPQYVYSPSPALQHPAMTVILVAFLLMVASSRPSRLRRIVRNPQLSGVVLWAGAHLLLNGDSRSLVLFGGLGLWALVEIVAINRRDGVWIKDPAPGLGTDLANLVIALVVVAVVVFIHPWLAGVPITGRLPQ